MSRQRISEETKELYKTLGHDKGQPLTSEEALKLLQDQFQLTHKQAEDIFAFFDFDHNGQLSMFEYDKFVSLVGKRAKALMAMFEQLEDTAKPGVLDMPKAFDTFKTMKKGDGEELKEEDLKQEMRAFEKTSMDVKMFINFMCGRLQLCKNLPEV